MIEETDSLRPPVNANAAKSATCGHCAASPPLGRRAVDVIIQAAKARVAVPQSMLPFGDDIMGRFVVKGYQQIETIE